jgi:hypothetical protein
VHRGLHQSIFPVRFSVVILIQPEQAPGGFCSFLHLGSKLPQSDCFPSPIRSSKVTPLIAVECQALVLIGTEPFPNSVLADFSVRSGDPMRRPGACALELGLHYRLLVQILLLCLHSAFGRQPRGPDSRFLLRPIPVLPSSITPVIFSYFVLRLVIFLCCFCSASKDRFFPLAFES